MKVENKTEFQNVRDSGNKESSLKADKKDIELFEHTKNQGQRENDNLNQNKDAENKPNDLSSIFSSLMSQNNAMTASQETTVQSINNIPVPNELEKLTTDLVDRILVANPKFQGEHEVRLTLSQNSGLMGTEIILRRDLDGLLSVVINAHNQEQFKKLVSVRNDLNVALERHEKSSIRLEIYNSEEDDLPHENSDDFVFKHP